MAKKDLEQGSPALEGVGPAEQPARPGDSETPHVQGAVKTGFQGAREASGSSSERGTRGGPACKAGGSWGHQHGAVLSAGIQHLGPQLPELTGSLSLLAVAVNLSAWGPVCLTCCQCNSGSAW